MSARGRDVLAHIDQVLYSTRRYHEPIDVGPFLDWADRRMEQLRRDLDNLPAVETREALPILVQFVGLLGWEEESGQRRLYRWRHDNVGGLAERADVEDALWNAGVPVDDIYPDLDAETDGDTRWCSACRDDVVTDLVCPWCGTETQDRRPAGSIARLGQGRFMTDEQIRAAHALYQRGLTGPQLGQMLYKQFGYSSPAICGRQLLKAFNLLGLPRRSVAEANVLAHTTHGLYVGKKRGPLHKRQLHILRHGQCQASLKTGERCPRAARPGTEHCGYHQPDELARRRAQVAKVNEQGLNLRRWKRGEAA